MEEGSSFTSEITQDGPQMMEQLKYEKHQKSSGLLESVGSAVFSLGYYVARKAESLPYPLGSTVSVAEDVVASGLYSITNTVKQSIALIISYLDDQLDKAYDALENCSKLALKVKDVSSPTGIIRLVGSEVQKWRETEHPAQLLWRYETLVKARADDVIQVLWRLPGLDALLTMVYNAGIPMASTVLAILHKRALPEDEKHVLVEEVSYPLDAEDVVGDGMAEMPHKKETGDMDEHEKDVVSSDTKGGLSDIVLEQSFTPVKEKEKPTEDKEEEGDVLSKLIDTSWCLGSL